MASIGPNNASTFANDATVGTTDWTNTSNAASSNNSYATAAMPIGGTTKFLLVTNFGLAVPANAIIDGIVVGIERSYAIGGTNQIDSTIKLFIYNGNPAVPGSVVTGNNKSAGASWTTTDTYVDFGANNDVWGATLTSDVVNSIYFGVGISSSGVATAQIDHVRMTVYYTPVETYPATHQLFQSAVLRM